MPIQCLDSNVVVAPSTPFSLSPLPPPFSFILFMFYIYWTPFSLHPPTACFLFYFIYFKKFVLEWLFDNNVECVHIPNVGFVTFIP